MERRASLTNSTGMDLSMVGIGAMIPSMRGSVLVLLVCCGLISALAAETLQPSRTVVGNMLTSPADPPMKIQVAPGFKYAGGQRFILKGVADAEQHFFVDAGGGKAVK